jgi:hypothetical protein
MKYFLFLNLGLFLFFSCSEKKSEIQNTPSTSFKFANPAPPIEINSGALAMTATAASNYSISDNAGDASLTNEASPSVSPVIASSGTYEKKLAFAVSQQKIVRYASIRFQVEDYKKSAFNIDKAVKDSGGYISTSQEDNNNYGLSTTLTIRVSSEKFDGLINQVLKEAKFLNYKNVNAEDVTDQFIDTEARLKTKKEVEKRYLDILKQAKTIEDILSVERQLAGIREEIEAKEGWIKQMHDRVSYSTISLQYYESTEAVTAPEDGFFARIKKGINTGWEMLVSFIVGVFYFWPFLFVASFMIFLFRRWRKKKGNS